MKRIGIIVVFFTLAFPLKAQDLAWTRYREGDLASAKELIDKDCANRKKKKDLGTWYNAIWIYFEIGRESANPDSEYKDLDHDWAQKICFAAEQYKKIAKYDFGYHYILKFAEDNINNKGPAQNVPVIDRKNNDLSDYFDLVDVSIVVENYMYQSKMVYRVTPILKFRPKNWIYLPYKYFRKQLPIEVDFSIIGQDSGCHSCNNQKLVSINSNGIYQGYAKENFVFNTATCVGDDGTISVRATTSNHFIEYLSDVKNAKGILVNEVTLFPDDSRESKWIHSWSQDVYEGDFVIEATEVQKNTNENQNWVDMGIRDEHGNIICWSNSDFALYENGSVGFVERGERGSTFGWGDVSGEKTGSNLSQYGGQYPPKRIDGDSRYDIITAKLGSPYRLPTQREIQSLIDNCDITKTTINLGTPRGTNGLPSWVQGQWMINDATLVRGRTGDGVINSSISVRIDGGIASYYNTSSNDYWEGPYKYSNGKITIGRLNLIVDNENQVLRDKSNNVYDKISSRTVSNKVTGILFTSRINGNTLLFAMPPSVSTYNSGNYYIVSNNSQEIDYWTGTLFDRDNDCAVCMKMTSDNGFGVLAEPRSYHKRIRAIKVDIGSGERLAEEKRIIDSIETARELEKKKQIENKRKQSQLILDELYGEWSSSKYKLNDRMKIILDNNQIIIKGYNDELLYKGQYQAILVGNELVFFNGDVFYENKKPKEAGEHGSAHYEITVYYDLKYDLVHKRFQVTKRKDCPKCQREYTDESVIYLEK